MRFQISKRLDMSRRATFLWRAAGLIAALCVAGLVILIIGFNPLEVYGKLITGSFGSAYRLKATMNKLIPLVILSLGVAVAFRMKFWNIGAEGQMAVGGIFASYIALNFGNLPPYVLLPLMCLAGCAGGLFWGLIPALLKSYLNTSETLVTLMLNYIALKWITYLQYGPWKEGAFPKIATFSENAILPSVFGVHIGWIIALVLVALTWLLMGRSKFGYEVTVIGENPVTAGYVGINVRKIVILAMLISGGICGLAGMIQSSAVEHTLNESFTAGLGFTAVITAWLARLSAPAILVSSLGFSILLQGSSYLEVNMSISSEVSGVLQGVIIFCVLAFEFFLQYEIKLKQNTDAPKNPAKQLSDQPAAAAKKEAV